MSADAIPTRSQGRPAKRIPSVDSVRSAKPATGEIVKAFPASNAQAATKKWRYGFRSRDLSHESWVGQAGSQPEEE